MLLIDQLDFINPDHVTILCKNDRLTIHISDGNSSVRLIYQLQQEDTTPYEVTYRDLHPNWCPPPHPPLEQSEPDSNDSNVPERPLRGM
jgi:hypothetical protein